MSGRFGGLRAPHCNVEQSVKSLCRHFPSAISSLSFIRGRRSAADIGLLVIFVNRTNAYRGTRNRTLLLARFRSVSCVSASKK